MIEAILAVVGDVQVFPSIIVIIADANALAPAGGSQPGLRSHIGESSVVIVVVQVIRWRLIGRETL